MINMTGINLWFSVKKNIVLERTLFWRDSAVPIISLRTKPLVKLKHLSTFQWTRAVQAFAILLVRYKIIHNRISSNEYQIILAGNEGSAAQFIHKALTSDSNWLISIFGYDNENNSYAKSIIESSRLDAGPHGTTAISINPKAITSGNINIFVNDRETLDHSELCNLLLSMEKQWTEFSGKYELPVLHDGDYVLLQG